MRNIRAQPIQCDEIWQFVGAKQKNVREEHQAQAWGDVWTWTGIDADSKLIVSWFLGARDAISAWWFMRDLCSRLITHVQLTSDGFTAYLPAVDQAFASEVDFAQLVKVYGKPREGQQRYSPARLLHTRSEVIRGNPDPKHISTSFLSRTKPS